MSPLRVKDAGSFRMDCRCWADEMAARSFLPGMKIRKAAMMARIATPRATLFLDMRGSGRESEGEGVSLKRARFWSRKITIRGRRSSAERSSNAPAVGDSSAVKIEKAERARRGASTRSETIPRVLPLCEAAPPDQYRHRMDKMTHGRQRPMRARNKMPEMLSLHISVRGISKS